MLHTLIKQQTCIKHGPIVLHHVQIQRKGGVGGLDPPGKSKFYSFLCKLALRPSLEKVGPPLENVGPPPPGNETLENYSFL